MPEQNPCVRCGACCALYPVGIERGEIDDLPDGIVPSRMTVEMNDTRSVMKGTEKRPIRCQALVGAIGQRVRCSIYAQRPVTCRKFLAVGETNVGNPLCDRARVTYGLVPLSSF